MLHEYLILFVSAGAVAALAVGYARFGQTGRSRRWFLTAAALVFGVWLDARWGVGMVAQFNTRTLPSIAGEIVHKEVIELSPWHGRTRKDVNLTYRYKVDGHSYVGSRIRLIDGSCGFSGRSLAKWGHSVGSPVPVFYDPGNPQTAFLSVGLNQADDWLTLLILAGANLLPLYIYLRAFRQASAED